MFFRILGKDLKRKKTMNIILLIFIILASMFTSSSVNNILAVTKGLNFFADEAGVSDYIVMTTKDTAALEEKLGGLDSVSGIRTEHQCYDMSWSEVRYKGKKLKESPNDPIVIPVREMKLGYFDKNNNKITSVEKGKFCANNHLTENNDLKPGEKVTFKHNGSELELEYAGSFKDIIFGSTLTANDRLIMSDEDYDVLFGDTIETGWNICYVDTTDVKAVEKAAAGAEGMVFSGSKDMLTVAFTVNLLIAYILLAASVGLVLVSLAILRFTIKFTIAEEFREIGVMKAVGIDNVSIRKIYLTKYLGISLIGSAIGFAVSIPFGKMMLASVTEIIYLGNTNGLLAGAIFSGLIVVVILLFCYGCTSKIKKLSPIDAVRSGQTGERFGKRSPMHLGRSRLSATGFLAVNDIISAPRQYGMMTAIFTLCLIVYTVVANLSYTMGSSKMIKYIGAVEGDAFFTSFDSKEAKEADKVQYGGEVFSDKLESDLAANGMPADCYYGYMLTLGTEHGEKKESVRYFIYRNISMDEYTVDEGSVPQAADEIVLTRKMTDELGVEIGDHVSLETADGMREMLVTGTISTLTNTGRAGLLYNDFEFKPADSQGGMGIMIRFKDDLTQEQIDKNVKKIREMYDTEQVYNSADFAKMAMGVGSALDAVKYLLLTITGIIVVLLTVLIERSFISKEKSEIALMKAVGATNGSIIAQHTLRFVLMSIVVCIIASAATIPLSGGILTFIMSMVGDVQNVACDFDPIEIFVASPAVIIAVTAAGAFLTALYTNTITSSDTASIE